MKEEKIFESVHNYTKFKIIEMIIDKYKDTKLTNLNHIEQLTDDVLKTLAICGMKFHTELKDRFEKGDD
jgi:hypothetical protein